MQASTRIWRHFDVWLLASVAVLTIAGVAMIRSAIGGNENLAELVPRQAIYAVIGLAVVLVTAALDYRFWTALVRPLYLLACAFLGLVLVSGFVGFGAARWFNVGIAFVQPTELAKVVMIIVLADFFARHRHEVHRTRVILRSLALVSLPAVLVFLQPDLSTVVDLGIIWLTLVWASGVPLRRLAVLAAVAGLLAVLAWPFLAEYQQSRVVSFLFPNPAARYGESYNVTQALIAIGSGGIFGKGYLHGTQAQLRFLKVRHTDFIFAVVSEEFGMIGALVFLVMISIVLLRCLRAARMARDPFGSYVAYGVASLLLFSSMFNIGMNLSLIPVSGVPLPFVSYGGSSLVASLFGIGLVESVILRHKPIDL
ncbi:MAG TPA: FtsW/RodA/SpoVE family cell cycle protein [Anaerolineales bacterium]|nr:FtsW/RodA/SpoVE family cell cycle protein [Anaerolineales bacterium]